MTRREGLLPRLRRGDVVLGDGAWGPMLMARGLPAGEAPERVNLDRPDWLTEIAALYLAAGAEVVTTNTFGASPLRLLAHGLSSRTEEICRAAVDAVRKAVGGAAWISGSIGPTGRLLAPLGDTEPAEVAHAFARQARALSDAGVDLLCVETMTSLDEALLAVRAARAAAPGLPVVATLTFDATPRGFFTVMGDPVPRAAAVLAEAGADVVGANCGEGIETMVALAAEWRRSTALPIAVRPNAGLPRVVAGVLVHPDSPDRFAALAPALLDAGVTLLGGCCGTTPEHVRALRSPIDARRKGPAPPV